jgi:hypothetical protein
LNDEIEFNSLLKEVGLTQQTRSNNIPVSQQPAREIQSAPEHNMAPVDFASQGVTP